VQTSLRTALQESITYTEPPYDFTLLSLGVLCVSSASLRLCGESEPSTFRPLLHPTHRPFQIIPHLIHPQPHHVPPQIAQPARTELVAAAQFAIPVPVIVLAIHFDIQLP